MKNISAIILTKNEELNIKICLNALKWCDEIIVIDDNSTDRTVDIAEKLGAKIYKHTLIDFSNQRNFGLSKANGEWVLFIDADEIVSEALAFEISNVIFNWTNGIENEYKGFRIPRIDNIWGSELKHGDSRTTLLRLAKKNVGKWNGMVHEKWVIYGKVGVLKNPIVHYPHQVIASFLREINFYTDIRVKELFIKNKKANLLSIILYPFFKFVFIYFFKKGLLDGIPGLIHAFLMSFHSFLTRSKLWLMWDSKS